MILAFRTASLFFLTIFSFPSFGTPGHDTGSGGDAVLCRKSDENPFEGWYSLDYLLTYRKANGNVDIVPTTSWKVSFARLRSQFEKKLPELLESLDSFTSNVENTKDHSRKRIWEEAGFGLVELSDERLTSQIVALAPKNCLDKGKLQVVQAVIRQPTVFTGAKQGRVIYRYVPSVFENLEKKSPLQLSFLLVHEWLWDLSSNVDRNRRLNRFFHSDALESLSREEIIEQLTGMGLVLPNRSPAVFRDDSCPPDPESLPARFAKIPADASRYIAGRFHVFARRRSCRVRQGCSSQFVDWSGDFDRHLSETRFLQFSIKSPSSFELRSLPRFGSKVALHSTCQVDRKTALVSCSALVSESGNRYRYQGTFHHSGNHSLILRGSMSNECLRLSDSGRIRGFSGNEGGPDWWFEDEVVFFSRYKMEPTP